uniref:Uncharacterized protein n=1 Tax=Octopus bimaculoides TaxID=37653 RepID=A0A0L8GDH5_OCTBM
MLHEPSRVLALGVQGLTADQSPKSNTNYCYHHYSFISLLYTVSIMNANYHK